MLIERFKIYIWFLMVTFMCICCTVNTAEFQRHPRSKPGIQYEIKTASKRMDFKPGYGEVMAKDSILYADQMTSGTTHVAKRMWPSMQQTISNIMQRFQAGAKMIKDMIMPKKKKKKTKTMKKVPMKMPPAIIMDDTPSSSSVTLDNYKPDYLISSSGQVYPYADDTYEKALLELEKKEEKKVEATMHTFRYNGENNDQLLKDNMEGELWKPIGIKPTTDKPHKITALHTTIEASEDIKPVHEEIEDDVDENLGDQDKLKFESSVEKPLTIYPVRHKRLRESAKSDSSPHSSKLNSATTTERPNYPEHFFEQKAKFLPTTTQPSSSSSFGRYASKRPNSERLTAEKTKLRVPEFVDMDVIDSAGELESLNSKPSSEYRLGRFKPYQEKSVKDSSKSNESEDVGRKRQKKNANGRGGVRFGRDF